VVRWIDHARLVFSAVAASFFDITQRMRRRSGATPTGTPRWAIRMPGHRGS